MAARKTSTRRKKTKTKRKTTRSTPTSKKTPERVIFHFVTSNGDHDVEVDEHIADHITGICRHGVTECGTCASSHRADKVAVALVAGGIGLVLGALSAAAEYNTPTRVLVIPGGV
jgi:hypothetical protein